MSSRIRADLVSMFDATKTPGQSGIKSLGRRVSRYFDRRRVMREIRSEEASYARGWGDARKANEVGTMKAIQRIESGICVTIGTLLTTGWVLAIGELFAHSS